MKTTPFKTTVCLVAIALSACAPTNESGPVQVAQAPLPAGDAAAPPPPPTVMPPEFAAPAAPQVAEITTPRPEAVVVTGSRLAGDHANSPAMERSLSRLPQRVAPPPPIAIQVAPARPMLPPYYSPSPIQGRDRFENAEPNPFKVVREEPVSTFSIDVDTASYAFVRASLNRNVLPPPDAVRTEELVNYFPYDYRAPASAAQPFSTAIDVFPSPWTAGRKLVRIGVRGYDIARAERPAANLVFLIDTSGSMQGAEKLGLVKQSLSMLVGQLGARDRVAIVAYAGQAGTVLEPTAASDKHRILTAIDSLGAGGGTAGAEGIRQAYALAERNFDPRSVNRVILATDGDFNVGITDPEALKGFVERQRSKGVFLSVLGFGMGNYNDAMMQTLAQNGNGAAAYIDSISEARKTLVEEATSTLFPIAKDVKIQIEFNPATVAEYRLVGYETRMLRREDFDNDKVDAGEVGSGQGVTALYEIVPVGGPRANGDLRYARPQPTLPSDKAISGEYGFVKIRYKLPDAESSRLISTPIDRRAEAARFADAPRDARFATGVASFAELLRGGRYSGTMTYDDVIEIVRETRGEDEYGYRSEFLQLVRAAKTASALARLER